MQHIEDLAVETYQKNIEYISQHQPELIKLLGVFEETINSGAFSLRYDLEYKDGYFDVKVLDTSKYIYSSNSMEISKQICDKVDFKKNTYLFEGFPLYRVSDENQKDLDDRSEGFSDIFPIMKFYIENTSESDSMKNIEKFIFIGTGLGFHISLIDEKIKAKEYLIIEDDIELFKLSLFTTKYYEIAQHSTLLFSVADDENLFLVTMRKFLSVTFFNNRYLKYSYFPTHSDNKIKQIQNSLASQSFAFFPYKQELKKYLRPLEYINTGYKVLNISKHLDSKIFTKKPLLLLAAGPSFKKNLEWVKKNHKKFIVVAITAVLNTLYEHNIKPDIVTHVDGYEGSMPMFDGIPTKEFLKDTIIVFGPFALSKLRDLFTKEQVFYHESSEKYFETFGELSTPCVGTHSLMLSMIFNASEIYLLGLDLAINQQTGATHSEGYADSVVVDMSKKNKLSNNIKLFDNLFPVHGNLTDIVYTASITHLSVQYLHENLHKIKKDNQRIYNLNDGARISGAIPTHIENIDINQYSDIDKRELYNLIYDEFKLNSATNLSKANIESLKLRLSKVKKIKDDIYEYINNVSHSNSDKYLYDLLGVISDVLRKGKEGKIEVDNITNVYYSYFSYVVPIVMDYFNTKGLKNEKRAIKKLDKALQNGMLNIQESYMNSLEDFIKDRC